jgi:hypothetical protein
MNETPLPAGLPSLRAILLDAALPLATYYVLHLFGLTDWAALAIGSGLATLRVLWSAIRTRTFSRFSALTLAFFAVLIVLAYITGDPRVFLWKAAIAGLLGGTAVLARALRRRPPITLVVLRIVRPRHAAEIVRNYQDDPDVRLRHRKTAIIWGIALLAESASRFVLVFLLPINILVAASTVVLIAFVGTLTWSTVHYLGRMPRPEKVTAPADTAS